ncbi:hypothetical protein QYM36_014799 [Artemia franciscana]|uniref:Uncharacterized protein n=1 Tax=Artemia franciscana TaxID=6661 RepID=A0AA88HD63_ARTSF|nr:hypothetical protein QYM36_014799 [Artemia franciscana]
MKKCVGQGFDKATSMSSLVNGAAGEIKRSYQLAYYFHCVSHTTNISCPKIVSVPILRNVQDALRQTISHFSSSAKRSRLLKKHLMSDNCREKGYAIRKDPVAIFDTFQTLWGLSEDEKTNSSQNFEERQDGKSLGRLLLSEVTKSDLDMKKCVGQGFDKATSMSSLVNGVAGEIKRSYQLAYYFHCVSHTTNISCPKIVSVPILRNVQDALRETISHFSSSAKRSRLLKKHLMSDNCRGETLIGLCSTRFVDRQDAISWFWDYLSSIISALDEMEG